MTRGELVGGHLSDEQLLEVYVDGSATSTGGGREHVEDCQACRKRFLQLTGTLDTWRSSVVADADAVFTEPRLERQRYRILSRLVALTRGARILPFPMTRARTFGPSPAVVMRRWVVAAAAAGLLVGVALGRMSFVPSQVESAVARPVASPTMTATNGARPPVEPALSRAESIDDELFLSQLEDLSARSRSRIGELQVIDQLTPRAHAAVARLR